MSSQESQCVLTKTHKHTMFCIVIILRIEEHFITKLYYSGKLQTIHSISKHKEMHDLMKTNNLFDSLTF